MNLRLFLLLPLFFGMTACGMKGPLERPQGTVPPSLYDRAFGAKQVSEPQTPRPAQDTPEGDEP